MMKRGYILLVLIAVISVFSFDLIDEITSMAVSSQTGITITIDNTPPDINISSLFNTTYNYLNSIYLNFTIYDQSSISSIIYSLNGGANITLSGNSTFNAQEGENTLILYTNDSLNYLNRTIVSFFVNTSLQDDIDLDSFLGAGSLTTNLSGKNQSEIQSLSNFTIHQINDGRITFGVPVNLSDDGKNHSYNPIKQINVSAYVNISRNRINIDAINLPNLNKTATLYLYGLTFSNPTILMNSVTCPASVCTKLSYSDGTLIFNVTGFSEFTAAEGGTGPQPSPSPEAGGGGGGGAAITKIKGMFEVSDSYLPFSLRLNESTFNLITITNIGNIALNLDAFLSPDYGFLKIEDDGNQYSFKLKPGESRKLRISIENVTLSIAGVYQSMLVISDGQSKKEIPIIIDYQTGSGLMDVDVTLLENYDAPHPGGKLGLLVNLFNLGATNRVDVILKYSIIDLQRNLLTTKEETLAVETNIDKVIILQLPSSIEPGKYVASVEAKYDGGVAVSSLIFEILPNEGILSKENNLIFYLQTVFIIVLILMLMLFIIIFILIKGKNFIPIKQNRPIQKASLSFENKNVPVKIEQSTPFRIKIQMVINKILAIRIKIQRVINKILAIRIKIQMINYIYKVNRLVEKSRRLLNNNKLNAAKATYEAIKPNFAMLSDAEKNKVYPAIKSLHNELSKRKNGKF